MLITCRNMLHVDFTYLTTIRIYIYVSLFPVLDSS